MAGLNIQYDEQGRIITPKTTTVVTSKATGYKPQQFGVSDIPLVGGFFPKSNIVNQPETVQGSQQEKLGGMIQQDILKNQQPMTETTPVVQPTTGLTTSATPAQIVKPIVSTPTPITAGQPTTTTSTTSKGLVGQVGDWYSKLNPSQQDSANKALMAAGFNLMQTGGTTYRTPISNAALFGQAGTVGLKTYEADQAAKARAAEAARKEAFNESIQTAKVNRMGLRGTGGAGTGTNDKDILKAAGTDYNNYLAGAKTKQVMGLPHDDTTAVTVGQWTYKMDKNGKLLASSPKTNQGGTVVWHDASGLTNNLRDYWTNQLHPERGGTAITGKPTGGAYLAMHNGKQGMYDPSTKMFTPL